MIDKNLSLNQHVERLLPKLNSELYALNKMSLLCNIDTLRIIYFSYLYPHIAYGLYIYGATTKYILDEIIRVQKIY